MGAKAKRRKRLRAVPAELVRPGDILWSSATERPLFVVAAMRELVDPSGDLMYREQELGDPDDDEPRKPAAAKVPAIIFSVRGPAGDMQRLGAFAPTTKVQVLR